MRLFLLPVSAVALTACSGQAATPGPPLANIERATLTYANCVLRRARQSAARPGSTDEVAQQVVASCAEARSEALNMRSVPVMFSSVDEFDTVHLDIARHEINEIRRNSR